MKKTRSTESQIVNTLKETDAEVLLEEPGQHGLSNAAFDKWKAK